MSTADNTQGTGQSFRKGIAEPITVTRGTTVEVTAAHGSDWFPLVIRSGLHQTTLYLRRAQLHALRLRLDEIDDGLPQPEGRP